MNNDKCGHQETQPADLLALVAKLSERFKSGNSVPVERTFITRDEYELLESLAAHRGEVEPVAWQRRIRGDSGKWLGWEEYHDGGSGFPSKLGRWDTEYRQLYTHPPQAQAGAGDATCCPACEVSGQTVPVRYTEDMSFGRVIGLEGDYCINCGECWVMPEKAQRNEARFNAVRQNFAALEPEK